MKKTNLNLPPEPGLPEPSKGEIQALVPHRTDWLTVAQFGFSLVGAFLLLGISLISTLVMFLRDGLSGMVAAVPLDISPYLFAAGVGFSGLLLIPSAYFSGRKLFGEKPPPILEWGGWVRVSYFFPFLIILGYFLQVGSSWSKPFLPLVHVLANGLGILWLLSLARQGLPGDSASRFSGLIVSGLVLTPMITFVLEAILLIGVGLVWVVLLGTRSDFSRELMDLAVQFQNSPQSPQLLQEVLGKFVSQPVVIGTILAYMSIFVPLIEELFKPAAVWLLVREKLQPWQGFLVGSTAGAGYALFENLSIGSNQQIWTFVFISRMGTAAMHILTTGLVGWGLASAFTEKKVGRLAAAFFTAVLLHGIWNGINLLSVLGDFQPARGILGGFFPRLGFYGPVGLVILGLGSMLGIFRAKKIFQRAIMARENLSK